MIHAPDEFARARRSSAVAVSREVTEGGIKRGRASLVGGIAVGIAVLALWVVLARDLAIDTNAMIVCGALVAIAVAAWIRIADL
jgi:predicted lysophospholipase L1 biosynthesis ABC-type transport system permease subunit